MIDNKPGLRGWPCALACGLLLCVGAASAGDAWTSTAYLSLDFGGAQPAAVTHLGVTALPRDWRADARALRSRANALPALAGRSPLSLDFAPAQQLSLRLLDSEIAGYRFAGRVPMLNQTDAPAAEQPAPAGNWFSRNWWEIGLGVAAAGALAASSGGSHHGYVNNGSSTNANSGGNSGTTGVGSNGSACVNGACLIPCGTANTPACVIGP